MPPVCLETEKPVRRDNPRSIHGRHPPPSAEGSRFSAAQLARIHDVRTLGANYNYLSVYDGRKFVSPTTLYRDSIMIYTYGKTLLTPGQRLGYLALSPDIEDRQSLRELMTSSQILCGWAVSSALMQHALARFEKLSLDVGELQARRDRFVAGLREAGYDVHVPEGAFYITPKTPIDDDVKFAVELAKEGVFCLPGRVVHMPGYLPRRSPRATR